MSFSQTRFLGATVKSFSSSIGWNGASSSIEITLVEDLVNGDLFTPVTIDTPVYFQFGNFRFFGLFEKWTYSQGPDGLFYNVHIVDPRKLLDAVQLVVGNYGGSTNGIKNVINCFSYWENALGFGGAQVNDTGMPWKLIRDAIGNICNQPTYTDYGGPITYKDYLYSIDLSELPALPNYFRINGASGTNISLMDFIHQICDAGGMDFFVELIGYQIKIKTQARWNQPPLGTISNLVENAFAGIVIRNSIGLESRNEVSSAFLVGGEVQGLYKADLASDNIRSFWGIDTNGNPILGENGQLTFRNANDEIIHTSNAAFFSLNCSEVADILGGTQYRCTDFELRLALAGNTAFSSWCAYMRRYKSDIARTIGITSVFDMSVFNASQVTLPNDLVSSDRANILGAIQSAIRTDQFNNSKRVFNFVLRTAREFLGKKFAVALPFVYRAVDAETQVEYHSYDIGDGGYVGNEGLDPFINDLNGLNPIYYDIFQTQDGRFTPFAFYNQFHNYTPDLNRVNPNNSIIDTDGYKMWAKMHVDKTMYFRDVAASGLQIIDDIGTSGYVSTIIRQPMAIINVDPIFTLPDSVYGDIPTLRALLSAASLTELPGGSGSLITIPAEATNPYNLDTSGSGFRGGAFSSLPWKIHPTYFYPDSVHIPLKSNISNYGPWFYEGVPGKVNFIQDNTLNPWTYGSFAGMNNVAIAKIQQSITQMQVSETGFVEVAGSPDFSLGEIIQNGMPNITHISVNFGSNVTTTYRFETFVPRFGQIGKYNLDRTRRLSHLSQQWANDARKAIRLNQDNQQTQNDAYRGFLANYSASVALESPSPVFISTSISNGSGIRNGVSVTTVEEAVRLSNADDNEFFQKSALVSLDSLFHPYIAIGSGINMPKIEALAGVFARNTNDYINNQNYNPWNQGNDIELCAYGDSYSGINSRINNAGINSQSKRVVGLRGPVVIAGYGMDIFGNFTNSESNIGIQSNLWKVGPVDFRWDQMRGVWTQESILKGRTEAIIPALTTSGVKNYGTVRIYVNNHFQGMYQPSTASGILDQSDYVLQAYNWFSTAVASGLNCICSYVPTDNKWYITSADCV